MSRTHEAAQPWARRALPRRGDTLAGQDLRGADQAVAIGSELEDVADNLGLGQVDLSLDVISDPNVVVPVDDASRHVAALGLAAHGVVGPLLLLAAEAKLLGDHEHLEWGARLERIHEPEEPRALDELGARDPASTYT
jgi:hypothetical protein